MGTVASVLTTKSPSKYSIPIDTIFDHKEMSVLIADNPVLRAYFVKYIKLGTWIEKLPNTSPEFEIIQDLYLECDCVIPIANSRTLTSKARTLSKWNSSSSSQEYASSVFEYVSSNSRSSISLKSASTGTSADKLSLGRGKSYCALQSVDSFCFTDFGGVDSTFSLDEMAAIFFVTIFPYFRESAMFNTFKNRLFTQCESTKSLDSAEFLSQDDEQNDLIRGSGLETRGGNQAQKLVYNAAALFQEEQLFSMLSTTAWYNNHIPSVLDNNTMSISIASCSDYDSVDSVRCYYPLVYVNKAFETLSGYSRQDVLGKSCTFLQGPKTNAEAVGRIRDALQHRNAVREVLVNYKKNGKEFKCLLVLSPVFDKVGACTHILAVQLDVSVYPASPQDIKLMEDLLALLPGMISTNLDIKIFQLL